MLSEKFVYMRSKEKIVDNSIWFHVTGFVEGWPRRSDDQLLNALSYAVVDLYREIRRLCLRSIVFLIASIKGLLLLISISQHNTFLIFHSYY